MKTAGVRENQEKMVFFAENRLSAVGVIPPVESDEADENG